MKTNDLISILTQAAPPRRPMRLGLAAAIITLLSAVATIIVLGLRPGLAAGHPPASFWMKTLLLGWMAVVSLAALDRASKPLATKRRIWPMAALAIFAAICVAIEWATVDARTILGGFLLPNFPCCLISVTIYGSAGMAGFVGLIRRYAPADPERCAGLAGLAAAAAAAVGYSIHCPLDSPTFIVVAYGLPMIALWALGRWLLPRKLNW
ncbi:MAG: DUF1109 domain-containing protein [Alphaproteobacteria bacterium]|nr:DUF1109 domain-containing protein [Alphaproteobacteria bacterium]